MTNQEILVSQTRAVLDSIFLGIPDSVQIIEFNAENLDAEKSSFLLNNIANIAGKYRKTVSLESGDLQINFEDFHVSPLYTEKKIKIFGFKKTINRNISVKTNGIVENRLNQKTIYGFRYELMHADQVESSDLTRIERSPYTFTKGSMINELGWTKYLEPGIVFVSVSTLVYLFFSMRY